MQNKFNNILSTFHISYFLGMEYFLILKKQIAFKFLSRNYFYFLILNSFPVEQC